MKSEQNWNALRIRIDDMIAIVRKSAAFVLLLWVSGIVGCSERPDASPSDVFAPDALLIESGESVVGGGSKQAGVSSVVVQQVERFCGDCHPLPQPETFPKQSWEEEVVQGFDFYISSGRTDLVEPNRQDVIEYYTSRAPERLKIPHADEFENSKSSTGFQRVFQGKTALDTAVSYAHIINGEVAGQLLAADMNNGGIYRWEVDREGEWSNQKIGSARHACRLTKCDWNDDCYPDYLVGEIGSYGVGDHANGRVSLLLGKADGQFDQMLLAEGLARVVEAQPIDYDVDGDLDVLIAEFGYLKTGALKLLRNEGGDVSSPIMKLEIIDPRHGSLGVRVLDIDQDGHTDFVTAFGQEYESVEVFYGNGRGEYAREQIFIMPDPSYNSSSFELGDIDGDGLVDIVHTNGDTLDTFMAKPYHGVRWLKNCGRASWEVRELGFLVGALHSAIADFDLDGDMDIAAAGMFPFSLEEGSGVYDSICWWEQKEDGFFTRHSLERDICNYVCCLASDVNFDGRPDLVLGNWSAAAGKDSLVVLLNSAGAE